MAGDPVRPTGTAPGAASPPDARLDRPPWQSRALWLKAALLLAITTGIVAGLIGWAGAGDVMGLLLSVGPGHLLLATALTLTLPFVHAWRFRAVLGAAGYEVGPRRAFDLMMGTWPISSFTPSKSGDLVKAYYLRREIPATVTVGGLLAERALDVAVVSALSLIGSLFFDHAAITVFSAAVVGCVLAFFVLAPWTTRLPLRSSWRDRIDLLLSSTQALARQPGLLALVLALTLTNWLSTILLTAVLFDAVGVGVPFLYTLAAMPPAFFAGLMPLTLAGMGTRDSMIILLFREYATSAQSLSVGILYAFFVRWSLSLLGIPFLRRLVAASPSANSMVRSPDRGGQ